MWQKFLDFLKSIFTAKPVTPQVAEASSRIQAALSWELPCDDGQVNQKACPERKEWSDALFAEIKKYWPNFQKAKKDLLSLRPDFFSLTEAQQITCVCELFSTVAEYESSWGYDHSSKDVNGRSEPQYRANGLFQMNEGDQKNYKTGTAYTYKELLTPIPNIKTAMAIVNYILEVRGELIFAKEERSKIISYFFQTLILDVPYGAKTIAVAKRRIAALRFSETKVSKSVEVSSEKPAWKIEAEKHKGQVETNATFSEWLRSKVKTFLGYKPPTIATSTYAWCGYFIVTVLGVSGVLFHKQGEMARNWGTYGTEIKWQSQGIPEGAIVWINHSYDCKSSSSNHVALANGSCTVKDFFDSNGKLKSGATIALLGGNQNNQVNVTAYPAKEICGVRWPTKDKDGKPVPMPKLPVTKSINCASSSSSNGSTR